MNLSLSNESKTLIAGKLMQEAASVPGNKILEFSLAEYSPVILPGNGFESYICIDNSEGFSISDDPEIEKQGFRRIPYEEIGEDCYFGRFHLVYIIFGFHGRTHLADEIMKLRRLLIKQGKMVIIDLCGDGIEKNYHKQMKLCGFSDASVEILDLDGVPAFMASAQK